MTESESIKKSSSSSQIEIKLAKQDDSFNDEVSINIFFVMWKTAEDQKWKKQWPREKCIWKLIVLSACVQCKDFTTLKFREINVFMKLIDHIFCKSISRNNLQPNRTFVFCPLSEICFHGTFVLKQKFRVNNFLV